MQNEKPMAGDAEADPAKTAMKDVSTMIRCLAGKVNWCLARQWRGSRWHLGWASGALLLGLSVEGFRV